MNHSDGRTRAFTDPRLCAATVDPPTFAGNIIETGTESDRLATTRARAAEQTPVVSRPVLTRGIKGQPLHHPGLRADGGDRLDEPVTQ